MGDVVRECVLTARFFDRAFTADPLSSNDAGPIAGKEHIGISVGAISLRDPIRREALRARTLLRVAAVDGYRSDPTEWGFA